MTPALKYSKEKAQLAEFLHRAGLLLESHRALLESKFRYAESTETLRLQSHPDPTFIL